MGDGEVVYLCGDVREVGFDHVIINMPDTHVIDSVRWFVEIVPQLSTV